MNDRFVYPYNPHEITILSPSSRANGPFKTREEIIPKVKGFIAYQISGLLDHQINDVFHLAVQNALMDTVDAETRALATSRIPSNVNTHETLRFSISLLYEMEIGFTELVNKAEAGIDYHVGNKRYYVRNFHDSDITNAFYQWNRRSDKIVEIMRTSVAKVGSELSRKPDFIRTAALIDLGEKTGLELTSKANAISFSIGETSDQGNTISRTLAANSSFLVEQASNFRVAGTRANNTDTLTITSKNGPNEITVTTNSVPVKTALLKDASKVLTQAEVMGSVVSTRPIPPPVATRTLPNINDLEVDEVQSVNIDGLFTGIRLNVTVTSEYPELVSIMVNSGKTSMGVTGVRFGTSKITVTGSNEAKAIKVEFNVTVVPTRN